MNGKKIVEIRNMTKDYGARGFRTRVLKGIDFTIYADDFIAIMGPSGSGKTTLLNILSSIDKPTQGFVLLDGKDISKISNQELSQIRRDKIGFVFQDYNLLDTMTLQDNIALPLSLNGVSGKTCMEKVGALAGMFGLTEHLSKYPCQLSGGQKQRGAVCRALITEPEILFADEPTGALDSKAGKGLLECFRTVNERGQAAILMVTHDAFSASYARDVYILNDGTMRCRLSRGKDRREFYDRIMEVQVSMGGDMPEKGASGENGGDFS
ncbi:MAG: ABC transporter ATP-binding protein [Blautia sp.]|nr:ABC transporter ATP-binding protein [Blautia sp.]MCM1201689.1 ABC transporter ATP-binding protein [Bacteroides fragilis]